VDRGVLERLYELQGEGDGDLVAELLRMFLRDAPDRLKGLAEAMQTSDAPAVRRLAHSLKGSSGAVGAARMTALCEALEQDAGSSPSDHAARLVSLEEEFQRVRAVLDVELARSAAGSRDAR
jgi:HPt (histidine-containing phosphotransfer) domain-containing protein